MTRARAAFSLALKVTAGSSVSNHCQQQQTPKPLNFHTNSVVIPVPCSGLVGHRYYTTQNITKNLRLITHDSSPKVDKTTLQVETSGSTERPLAVVLEWMLAKQKHIQKFASLYLNGGYDVLLAPLNPMQLLLPTKGSQLIAEDFLKFLESNQKYKELILHGFSVGGYLYGEICEKLLHLPEKTLSELCNRFKGQIWDSPVDVAGLEKGVAAAVFPTAPASIFRGVIEKSLQMHLHLFHDISTKHYLNSSKRFHENLVHAPALFFLSKTDPVGTVEQIVKVQKEWSAMGIQTFMKCWDSSPHVGHLQKHREEYIAELNKFLAHIKMPLVVDDKAKKPIEAKL